MQDARPRLWQPIPNFPDLAALNAWLERRCLELWREIPHGRLAGSLADAWAEEQPALMPLPPAFDGFVERRECLKHCVSDLAHAVFRYGQASKRPANIMAS